MKSFLVDFIEKHADNWLADLNIERPDILVKLDPVSRLAILTTTSAPISSILWSRKLEASSSM